MNEFLQSINQKIAGSKKVQGSVQIGIDTFHHFYIQLDRKLHWPSIHINHILPEERHSITDILLEHVPSFINGCSVLPEPRPRKDSNQIHYVRSYKYNESELIYIFKVSCQYMGGAENDEIIQKGRQGVTPEFLTDRIYYSSLLIPVSAVERDAKNYIVNFIPVQIKDAIFRVSSYEEIREFMGSILFDEIDFSEANSKITKYFKFANSWKYNKLFYPFIIDYLSLCMNLVLPYRETVDQYAEIFNRLFHNFIHEGDSQNISPSDIQFLEQYYLNWEFQRIFSRSGNPHWTLNQHPIL